MFKKELDETNYELPDPPKLELDDGFLNSLGVEVHVILEQKFTNKKKQEDAVLEEIRENYNFDEIKDAFNEAAVPHQLHFFYVGENSNFNQAIEFLWLSNEHREFIAFWPSDQRQNLMTNNRDIKQHDGISSRLDLSGYWRQNFQLRMFIWGNLLQNNPSSQNLKQHFSIFS